MSERRIWRAAFRRLREFRASRQDARNFVRLHGTDNLGLPAEVWRRACGVAWWDRNVN